MLDYAGLCMNRFWPFVIQEQWHFTTKNINQISIAIKLLISFSPLPFPRPRSSHILCISFVLIIKYIHALSQLHILSQMIHLFSSLIFFSVPEIKIDLVQGQKTQASACKER